MDLVQQDDEASPALRSIKNLAKIKNAGSTDSKRQAKYKYYLKH